jgi:predicted lipoprotein with Yx(FWY)xxD motif
MVSRRVLAAAAAALALLGAGAGAVSAGAAATPTVAVHSSKFGSILVNGKGDTLYLWAADKRGKSTCSGPCADVWPLLIISGKPVAGPGVKASKLSEYSVGKGKFEVTYYGHPLYTYISDVKPGDITGQGSTSFGAAWWVVSPSGQAITKS